MSPSFGFNPDSSEPGPALAAEAAALLPIDAVERETGLSKELLRVWERRYGFPRPQRDARGQRWYTRDEVDRLRRLRRLVGAGHRPGRLLALDDAALDALTLAGAGATPGPAPAAAEPPELLPLDTALTLLRQEGADGLGQWLQQALARAGLARFVIEGIALLSRRVGEAWLGGEVRVYEEHLVTEAVQRVLRAALQPWQGAAAGARPRVLLTTVPGEAHQLGLLMAEALLSIEGASCTALGAQTPTPDILQAVDAQAIDIVALSFSGCLSAARVERAVLELRAGLPPAVALWVGGSPAALPQPGPPGLLGGLALGDIAPALAAWRHGAAGEGASDAPFRAPTA